MFNDSNECLLDISSAAVDDLIDDDDRRGDINMICDVIKSEYCIESLIESLVLCTLGISLFHNGDE